MPKAARTITTSSRDAVRADARPNGEAAASGPTPALSIMDAARAHQMLDDARNRWDERAVKLSDTEAERAEKARDRLDERRDALRDYILATPAATLGEALAQVAAAMTVASIGESGIPVGHDDRPERFRQLLTVLASIAGVLIREAGIEPAEVCGEFTIDAMAREFPYIAGEGV